MIAVVPVRDGVPDPGGPEAIAEAGGRVILIGSGVRDALESIPGDTREVRQAETPEFRPAAWAGALAPIVEAERVVILPASAGGRDLAPRLAVLLDRDLAAGALRVAEDSVTIAVPGLHAQRVLPVAGPLVVTLLPSARAWTEGPPGSATVAELSLSFDGPADAVVTEVTDPDPESIDLAEARRIIGAGIGLPDEASFRTLQSVSSRIGASVGATRPVVDAGWCEFPRQIGTTGAIVDPDLYISFAISGAVQHTSGLGNPDHIISVNTDPSCPMMSMSDLAVVADAPAVLEELDRLLPEEDHDAG